LPGAAPLLHDCRDMGAYCSTIALVMNLRTWMRPGPEVAAVSVTPGPGKVPTVTSTE
jgi:hypothetical protein